MIARKCQHFTLRAPELTEEQEKSNLTQAVLAEKFNVSGKAISK